MYIVPTHTVFDFQSHFSFAVRTHTFLDLQFNAMDNGVVRVLVTRVGHGLQHAPLREVATGGLIISQTPSELAAQGKGKTVCC